MQTSQATLVDHAGSHKGRPSIDVKFIEAELQELTTARVKVKLNKHLDTASHIRETDQGYAIELNPGRIRTPAKLDEQLNLCRQACAGLA